MASYASPPIVSAYTRQLNAKNHADSRALDPAAGLDEPSLAAWWDSDALTTASGLATPYRKQLYEATKWRNADLLFEEDGADFLGDDPFATPAQTAPMGSRRNSKGLSSSIRKNAVMNSARKASARRSTLNGRQARISNISHQRDLTLADLTPRSRRVSKTHQSRADRSPIASPKQSKPRRSSLHHRSLRLSANGPGFEFTPEPHQPRAELSRVEEVIEPVKFDRQEQLSRAATPAAAARARRSSGHIANITSQVLSNGDELPTPVPVLGDAFNENSPFFTTSTPFQRNRDHDESRRISKGKSIRRSGSFPVVLASPIRHSPAPPSEPEPESEAESERESPKPIHSPNIVLDRRKSGNLQHQQEQQEQQVQEDQNQAESDGEEDNLHNSIPGAFDFVPSKPLDTNWPVRILVSIPSRYTYTGIY